ncbi:hypothetical protein F5883DRAFT_541026 [Diaporthe sp. PMI_573]|nr:hypothetical protein F5883DRAFT_541026 [Diaporthaceae sp. PMI_573]
MGRRFHFTGTIGGRLERHSISFRTCVGLSSHFCLLLVYTVFLYIWTARRYNGHISVKELDTHASIVLHRKVACKERSSGLVSGFVALVCRGWMGSVLGEKRDPLPRSQWPRPGLFYPRVGAMAIWLLIFVARTWRSWSG